MSSHVVFLFVHLVEEYVFYINLKLRILNERYQKIDNEILQFRAK